MHARVFPTFCAVEGIRTDDEANGVRNARLWARVLESLHRLFGSRIRPEYCSARERRIRLRKTLRIRLDTLGHPAQHTRRNAQWNLELCRVVGGVGDVLRGGPNRDSSADYTVGDLDETKVVIAGMRA